MRPLALYRFPDIPSLITPNVLETLRDGEWMAQLKFNGWRAMYDWDGSELTLWGRKKRALTEPSAAFVAGIKDLLRPVPPCLLDGEVMGRRGPTSKPFPERAWLFDTLEVNGRWMGGAGAYERYVTLKGLVTPELVVPCVTGGYPAFFQRSKAWCSAGCEGIVLKRVDSKFFGKVNDCYANPGWLKCKFLGGEDGQRVIA